MYRFFRSGLVDLSIEGESMNQEATTVPDGSLSGHPKKDRHFLDSLHVRARVRARVLDLSFGPTNYFCRTLCAFVCLCRDIVSGCDHGHVHVLSFSPDMVGVPSMKVRTYHRSR